MTEVQPNTLYIVSTPIGNLEDITLRALEVLKGVDIIACEDTRHSMKLLTHFGIKKRLIAYHSYNEKFSSSGIVKLLNEGNSVAIVSDGGTPCISDPGYTLVNECISAGLDIVPVPGATAFVPLLTVSGFRTDIFHFYGFLSCKGGRRQKDLTEMKETEGTLIIYESPHRVVKLLTDIKEIFPEKMVCVGKEISKINEKIYRGDAASVLGSMNDDKIVGEFVVLIANY